MSHTSTSGELALAVRVGAASALYAAALAVLERRVPIKPNHVWAEVTGGVLLTLVPVTLHARRSPPSSWQQYERMLWTAFISAGTPIVLWQLAEEVHRHAELMRYVRESRARRDMPAHRGRSNNPPPDGGGELLDLRQPPPGQQQHIAADASAPLLRLIPQARRRRHGA